MKSILSLLLLLSSSLTAQSSITWRQVTKPTPCVDINPTPCYWPNPMGWMTVNRDGANNGILVYVTRQDFMGTVTVSGGTNVSWVDGDQFSIGWALAAGDQIKINGVSYGIVVGSVTTTTLTLTSSAPPGTFSYQSIASTIYATDVYRYSTSSHTFTPPFPGSTGSLTNASANIQTDGAGTWPADRQQSTEQFWDSSRNKMWLVGGINTGRSWNSNAPPSRSWQLNPTTKTWAYRVPATFPTDNAASAGADIDVDHQVILRAGANASGFFHTWVSCPTDLNGSPGTLTANQIAAGCTAPDSWDDVTTSGFSMPINFNFIGNIYSHATGKFYAFSQHTPQIYSYTPLTKTWATVGASCSLPVTGGAISSGQESPAWTLLASGKIFYHYFPSTASGNAPSDWTYDPVGDTCASVANVGGGPIQDAGAWGVALAEDPATGIIFGWMQGLPTSPYIWEGTPSTTTTTGQFRILSSWPSGHAKWIKVSGLVSLTAGGTATVTLTGPGGLNVPLTVQEALVPGAGNSSETGVNRTAYPFSMGVPLPDSAGITSTTGLSLSGTVAVPTGNLAVDGGATITVTTGAAVFGVKKANFNLLNSVVVGSTTLVTTSTSQTRGLIVQGPSTPTTYPDNVTCGSGSGQSPCTKIYSSANDSSSTCVIEENGPVMAVLKCNGTLFDNASHPYMHFTVREKFYSGRSFMALTAIRRNADYDTAHTPSNDCNASGGVCTGATFNVAFKGMKSYEARVDTTLTGTLSYSFALDVTNATGTVSGSDSAYIYIGQMQYLIGNSGTSYPADCDYLSSCANSYTTDTGWNVVKNASVQTSGPSTQVPNGWANIEDSSHNGVLVGHYQMAAYWPKSLEFDNGGGTIRLGFGPSMNGNPSGGPDTGTFFQYQCWPCWNTEESYMEFHVGAISNPSNNFFAYQQQLIARPTSIAYTNSTNVFPYPIVDPTVEDSFYYATQQAASPSIALSAFCFGGSLVGGACIEAPDRGLTTFNGVNLAGRSMTIAAVRKISWPSSGPLNQTEFRWSDLLKFYQRGYVGRWTNASHWYRRMFMESAWPHSDGGNTNGTDATINSFLWSTRPAATTGANAELDASGWPAVAAGGDPSAKQANSSLSFNNWMESLHDHWDGILDYYNMTGDETIKEGINSWKAYYVNPNTSQGGNISGLKIARAIGLFMRTGSRFGNFLASIGDSDAAAVTTGAQTMYVQKVQPDPCTNNFPTGCTMPNPIVDSNSDPVGISRVRGHPDGSRLGGGWCPETLGPNAWRIDQPFETGIEIEGILNAPVNAGSGWTYYQQAQDLAFGAAQAQMLEGYNYDGNPHWVGANNLYNGFRYELVLDRANTCDPNTPYQSGTYTTADGTHVTLLTGPAANTFWTPAGGLFGAGTGAAFVYDVGGGGYVQVSSVTDATHIVLASSIGAHLSSTPFSMNQIDTAGTIQNIGGVLYDGYTTAVADQTIWAIFYALHNTQNSVDWAPQFKIALQRMANGASGGWPADFGIYQMGSLIYWINSAPTTSLQDVTITSFANLGGGQQQIGYTVPVGSSNPRLKYDTTHAVQADLTKILQFDNLVTQTFGINPNTNLPWFAATEGTSQLSAWTAGAHTATITTGANGLSVTNFSLKAIQATSCSLSPGAIGPYTNGTPISQTFTPTLCGTSTCSITAGSLTGSGLSLGGTQNCVLSGVPATGTYSFTISYDTASTPITLVVNPSSGGGGSVGTITTGKTTSTGKVVR